jgi:hypothetical protein
MRDPEEIRELEAQIAADKQKFSEIERLNTDLVENTDRKGFSDVSTELKYRGEIEGIEGSIRRGEEKLAGAKSQPNWPRE